MTKVDDGYSFLLMATRSLNLSSIKEAMRDKGLSQSSIASELNVSREIVSQWLKGKKHPRPALLLQLSKFLNLPFQALVNLDVSNQPQVAYRMNRKKAVTEEQNAQAIDMGHSLKYIISYLDGHSVFEPPILQEPELSYTYIEQVAEEIRSKYKIDKDEISFNSIISLYEDFKIVIVPVLWGKNGANGLCVKIPNEGITFIYANLEKVTTDFKFWLLHEVVHAMTPSLTGEVSEEFADALAGALLVPRRVAEKYYKQMSKIRNVGNIVNLIKEVASRLIVSPYTIYHQLNRYAEDSGQKKFELNIGPATTVFNKQIKLVSEIIFEEEHPEPEKYVSVCTDEFNTPFFGALSKYLIESEKDSGFVQRVLNIPVADAKGVYQTLVSS